MKSRGKNMNFEVVSSDEQRALWDLSVRFAKSRMIPSYFLGKVEDVFVCVLYGREFGISPINALNSICLINGQVTMKASTMNAIVRNRCPGAIIHVDVDYASEVVSVSARRDKDQRAYISRWDLARAGKMNLLSKDNWKKMPIAMLQARAISEALRIVFADVLLGFYSTEEMTDVEQSKDVETQVYDASQIDLVEYVARERDEHPDWFEIGGNNYKFQNGKLRGKQMHEIDRDELDSYHAKLEQREEKSELKNWETEVKQSIEAYLERIETQKIE
jgi:hypothetical protein